MELKDLTVFIAVADAAGFRRAAKQLGVRQSTVSKRVRAFEDELGVSLFERHHEGVRLTYAGATLLEDIRPLTHRLDSALRRARAGGRATTGKLSVGIVASISSGFVHRLLSEWRCQHPDVGLELTEAAPEQHLAAVRNRRLDTAVVTGVLDVLGCDVENMFSEPIYVVLSTKNELAIANVLGWPDIQKLDFIVSRDAPGPEIHDYIVKHIAELGRSPRLKIFSVSREALMSMVGLGFGATLASGAEAAVIYPDVSFVPLAAERLPFSLVWVPQNDNPALRRFLSLARILSRQVGTGGAPSRTPDP